MAKSLRNRVRLLRFAVVLLAAVSPSIIVMTAGAGLSFNTFQEQPANDEQAFAAKADKVVATVRRAVERDRVLELQGELRPNRSQVNKLAESVGVSRHPNGRVTMDVAVSLSTNTDAELKQAGFEVAARAGNIATVEVDVDRLPRLAALSTVTKIFGAVRRRPMNDRARASVGLIPTDSAWSPKQVRVWSSA